MKSRLSNTVVAAAACLTWSAFTPAAWALNPPQYVFSITTNQVAGHFSPGMLTVDAAGNLYVATYDSVMIKFAPNGSPLAQWGIASGGFAAAAPTDAMYITDFQNNLVQQFTLEGDFLGTWGSLGTNAGQFNNPNGIAVAADGTVYVADLYNNRIEQFDTYGDYLGQWGVFGNEPGQINNPYALAVDTNNNIYVTDDPGPPYTANFRVQHFLTDGTYVAQWMTALETTAYLGIAGLTADNSNRVYVVDSANHNIQVFNPSGGLLMTWGGLGAAPGQFNYPQGIAVDPTGNYVYVADNNNSRVQVFAYTAVAPLIYGQPPSQTVAAGTTVTLNPGVFGAAPLVYQWLTNGIAVAGATNATLTLANLDASYSGIAYSFVVTNALGTATSTPAVLTVQPALATTLPATGISATAAVLNGTAITGPNATTAWFEWGLDTGYGNATPATNLTDNATVSVSAALGGLNGIFVYHYRLDVSNEVGVVTGADQTFAVGLKPVVTTLTATKPVGTSLALNATVNPEGLATGAYFQWGSSTSYGNTTLTSALGSGAVPMPVTAVVSALAPGVTYHFRIVATNALGTVNGADATFIAGPWQLALPVNNSAAALAISADGGKVIAGVPYQLYASADGGVTWQTTNSPEASWQGVASSADGLRLAAAGGNRIYLSTNGGVTWSNSTAPGQNWYGLASSGDGSHLAAVSLGGGGIFTTTNAGLMWRSNSLPAVNNWTAIASSADGSKLVAAAGGANAGLGIGPLVTTTNGGLNWVTNAAPRNYWQAVACSADGQKMAAAAGGYYTNGPIYLTTNAGLSWHASTAPVTNWQGIASSADGTRLAAITRTGSVVYLSTNAGATWFAGSKLPSSTWYSIASSADGGKLAIGSSQDIYTLQTVVPPTLTASEAGGEVVLSWIVPSVNFGVQENPDLSPGNWFSLTNNPSLAPNSLQYQIVAPPSAPSAFYRLKEM